MNIKSIQPLNILFHGVSMTLTQIGVGNMTEEDIRILSEVLILFEVWDRYKYDMYHKTEAIATPTRSQSTITAYKIAQM